MKKFIFLSFLKKLFHFRNCMRKKFFSLFFLKNIIIHTTVSRQAGNGKAVLAVRKDEK